ncbi:MAG: hypothetical protein INR66_02995 [Gordonia polyisoprenivorans]|nr:hypothetical protein [Gordonia polyisoprenivorans]
MDPVESDQDSPTDWSWDRIARASSVGESVHSRIRVEAEALCRELQVPWADRWCDDSVAFVERQIVETHRVNGPLDERRSLQVVSFVGEGAVRRGAGWWVELLGSSRTPSRLGVYVPAENSLFAAEPLVSQAVATRTGSVWLDRYAGIAESRGRVLSGTGIRDARVDALNAAIESHLHAAVVTAGSTEDALEQARHARGFLAMHQPVGGSYGAECLGCRGGMVDGAIWPCDNVLRLQVANVAARRPIRCGTGRNAVGVRGRRAEGE